MFRQRLLTTLILVPLALLMIFTSPAWLFQGLMFIVVLGMGWEWGNLIPCRYLIQKAVFLLGLVAACLMFWFAPNVLAFASLLAWIVTIMAILTYPTTLKVWGRPFVVILQAYTLLPLFLHSFTAIEALPHGAYWLLYLFGLVWACDIGGYVMGKLFGKHKMIPHVSPGKTWEGTLGGGLWVAVLAWFGMKGFGITALNAWVELTFVTWLAAIFGDLSISLLKRRVSIKDTGALLPGHGGILDRLDSLLAAAPCFYYGLYLLNNG